MQFFKDTPSFGAGMGSSIADAINRFGEYKINQMHERSAFKEQQQRMQEERSRLGKVFEGGNLTPEQGQIIANVEPKHRAPMMSLFANQNAQNKQGMTGSQPQQMMPQQINPVQPAAQQPMQTKMPSVQQPKAPMAAPGQIPAAQQEAMANPNAMQQQQAPQAPQVPPVQQAAQQAARVANLPKQETKPQEDKKPVVKKADIKELSPAERKNLEVRKENAYKITKKERDEVNKEGKAAKANLMSLGRLKTLASQDKLQDARIYTALKSVHLDYPILQNADTQEFQEITNNFLRNARAMFGARISNFEMGAFLRTLPTLMNTKEGKERIIRNLELYNKPSVLREEAMREIIKENGGVPPLDLTNAIEERVAPKLDEIGAQFKEGIKVNTFQELPPASEYKGKKVMDDATGKTLLSDGTQWTEVG